MSQHETRDTGIPTRAIQESYLNMQQAHRRYRQARDEGGALPPGNKPHAMYQDAVLTFYELLRPYLKEESQLERYWNGQIPGYPGEFHETLGEAMQYYREHSVGVYQIQEHTNPVQMNQQVLTDGGAEIPQKPREWHELLKRPSTCRVVAVHGDTGGCIVKELRFAVVGLRELDHWQARVVTERGQGDGFMAGETHTQQRREYEPPQKITQAKRMLTEAANKLGALPDYRIEDSRDATFDYSDILGGESNGNGQ